MKCLKVLTEKDISNIDYAKPWYAARGIVLDEEGRIGMIYMKKSGFYGLPGGEIDEGESIEQTFLREIKEEIGCDCEIIRELGYVEQKNINNNVWTSYYFIWLSN